MRKTALIVFGTRPEAIKMAPVVLALQKESKTFQLIVCVTGQHREMLDQVLELFDINAEIDLDIMKKNQDLYDITARILVEMRGVLEKINPDIVMVHGDTTTSMAVALAAYYRQIPVAHVEAGLRTYNKYSPWPEEINRQITGRIAAYHFAPTKISCENLIQEGISKDSIYITGNTVIDALYSVVKKISDNPTLRHAVMDSIQKLGYNMKRIDETRRMVLITGHRRENFGDGFLQICVAIKELAETHPQVDFVYPMHLNPLVRKPIQNVFSSSKPTNVFFIEPLDYTSFVLMMNASFLILTDSGGVQEEAPSLGKPVLVMRDTTERPEAVEAGTVKLVGTNSNTIIHEVSRLLSDEVYYQKMSKSKNPYGDGSAAEQITKTLINILK